jgi:hypothetical protein
MRFLIVLGTILLLGALAAAIAYWAGASQGAPIALALAGVTLSIVTPMVIGQLGNWGVPGDEPPFRWRPTH